MVWRTAGAKQSVLSLLLSLTPPYSPSPPQKKKEEGTFIITGIFPARNLFLLQFQINSKKNRRGVKLQALQFKINSKTNELQRVKTVIISSRWYRERESHHRNAGLKPAKGVMVSRPEEAMEWMAWLPRNVNSSAATDDNVGDQL